MLLALTIASPSGPSPALTTLRSYEPAGNICGSVSVPGLKFFSSANNP